MGRPLRGESELPFDRQPDPSGDNPPARPQSASVPVSAVTPAPVLAIRKPTRFAGLSRAQLGVLAVVLAAAIWGMWATAKIFALEDRRVVSVRLAAIVNGFVTAEARSGTPPDQLAARTAAFMTALDTVLKNRAADGQVVLVGEAVVASSVPDVTTDVVADLAQLIHMAPPAAMPPAMAPAPVPQAYPPPSPVPMAAPDPSNSPFAQQSGPSTGASLEP